jgi:DNA-binding MarR family transcriptional regulator
VSDTLQLPRTIPLGALTSILFRSRSIILNHHLKSLGLSAGQFPIMMYLMHQENITQETLVKHFHIDRGTIARSVKKLEDAGYLIRTTDPENRREVRLYLSEKGRGITPVLIRIDAEWEEAAFSSLSGPEKIQFRDLLQKVALASLQRARETGSTDYGTCLHTGDCT